MERWRRASWWFVLPAVVVIASASLLLLIIPAAAGRRWALPTGQQVKLASGYLEPHISSAGPYTLEKNSGGRLHLFCLPEGMSRFSDCLGNGFGTAAANGRSVSITYFEAQGPLFSRNVLVSAKTSTQVLLDTGRQLHHLKIAAEVEDSDGAMNLISGGIGVMMLLYAAWIAVYKLVTK